jgi:hypothetical protein
MFRETIYLQLISLNLVALTALLPTPVVRILNVMALFSVTIFHFTWHFHPANRLKILLNAIAVVDDELHNCGMSFNRLDFYEITCK